MYTEDDLREAFYKGREQACLPDEKGTHMFIRPTFNGYLRELDGKEDPHANFKQRVDSLINSKDYDYQVWEDMHNLRKLQDNLKVKGFCPVCGYPKHKKSFESFERCEGCNWTSK